MKLLSDLRIGHRLGIAFAISIAFSVLLAGYAVGWSGGPHVVEIGLYALALAIGAYTFVPSTLRRLAQGKIGVGTLMTIAAIGAVILGEVGEAAMLAFLFSISEGLEEYSLARTRRGLRALLALVPDEGLQCVVRTAYRALVPEGLVGATVHGGAWIDVGTPEAYLQVNLDVLRGTVQAPLDPWTLGSRGPGGSWVGEDAVVAGEITGCVIGAGATVPAGAVLEDCVVWDGCQAPAERLSRAVVYDDGVLRI